MSTPRKDTRFLNDIAQKLKDLRNERGLSQLRVTMDTGVNVGRAESGTRSSSAYSIALLCKYYGISLDDFYKGVDIGFIPWE